MTMPIPAVEAVDLSKSFGSTQAVANVELSIPHGAMFGLLGPDGAGKSTLIRMLATVLTPDTGKASVFGRSVVDQRSEVTALIGYMSQRFSMYPDLSVRENLDFFATVRGVPSTERHTRAANLLQAMGLAEFADRQAQHLSGGMKQKLMLATTLMHSPDLLLLDEPTTGVDPVSRREFWRILAGLHREGKTVLVATPYMDEAERCTQIAFLADGRITQSGTPAEITGRVPGHLVEITMPNPRQAIPVMANSANVESVHLFGDLLRVLWNGPQDSVLAVQELLDAAHLSSAQVTETAVDMETAFAYLAEHRDAPRKVSAP